MIARDDERKEKIDEDIVICFGFLWNFNLNVLVPGAKLP